MVEPELEPREVLRRTRIEVMPYLREIAKHSRAIIPRMEVSKRWIDYYEALSRVRPLTNRERRRLEEHRKTFELYAARREIYSAAGRYARTKKPADLVALRLAQSRYYEAKAETLPPEKAKELREKMVPLKEAYDKLQEIKKEIEEKCKRYLAAKYRKVIITPTERYIRMESLRYVIQDLYIKAYEMESEIAEKFRKGAKGTSEFIEHYREMKRLE